jgi:DNA-directed RNA polymerase subunit RPC12/RpoP
MMEFVVYIYAAKSPATELVPFRCPRCGRIVFRHNAKQMLLSNAYGASYQDLPPGNVFVEYKCHSCKSLYKILFQ